MDTLEEMFSEPKKNPQEKKQLKEPKPLEPFTNPNRWKVTIYLKGDHTFTFFETSFTDAQKLAYGNNYSDWRERLHTDKIEDGLILLKDAEIVAVEVTRQEKINESWYNHDRVH